VGWTLSFVVFSLIWWTVLFAVLPLGVRPREASLEEGGWRGAPEQPQLLRKVVLTTLVSAVIFVGVFALERSNLISFRAEWLSIPD
jgi:predicted secreted protein